MEAPAKHDPFIDTTFVDSGNESSDSSGSSESSSSGHSSTGSPESDFSANSSDSEASGAPLRDTTKKLFKELYNNCKESNVVGVKAILPEVSQLARSGRATNLLNQPNVKDRYRRTPLLVAIEGGNLDLVQMLLDNGADPKRETKAPDSCNGIMLAFRFGHTAIAEFLLDHDYFELENSDNIFNYTLLHQAAYGHVDCAKMLIAKGANVNASSAFQVTPLHSAVSAGNPQVVAELLAHGADANATDKFGRTPLYLACNAFNLPIVKLLVEEGKCNVNITDTNHNSAFDIADKKNLREVCRYLLAHGAIPRAIKENATGLGTLRFFRPYIAAGLGHPDHLPTARTKAGLCAIGTKLYLNGGVGLKSIQNRPDEALFNYPNLLTDLFVLDLKDRKLQSMVSPQDVQNLMTWCQDTTKGGQTAESTGNTSLSSSSAEIVNDPESNVPIVVTPPTPPRTPVAATPLVMSREFRSARVKVSKDGLIAQAMPQGYQSGMKKLSLPYKVTAQTAMASYQTEPHFVACVRATAPFSRERTSLAYWEMHVLEATEKIMTIGFTPEDFPLNRYHPGWCLDSYAYHNDDGSAFHVKAPIPDHGFQWGPRFTTGDIVGAGINFHTNEVFFTKNGKFLGVAYRGVTGSEFYATISFGTVGAKAKVNLGRKPFKFSFNVPTLSWSKLGHTAYSPLAFVPHPDGNGKFIQISYGDAASKQGLISQRGNHWHSPKVSIINTNLSAESIGYTDVSEHFVHAPYIRKPTNEEKKRERDAHKDSSAVHDPVSALPTSAQPSSTLTQHAPATAMQSPHMLVLHHPPSSHPTPHFHPPHGPHPSHVSPRSAVMNANHPSTGFSASGFSSPTTLPKTNSPGPQRSSVSTVSSPARPKTGFSTTSQSASATPEGMRKRRPSKPYKRTNRYADSSDSETSSISSVLSSTIEDSVDDSMEASYDSTAGDYASHMGNYPLRGNDSVASFASYDSGADSEDDENGRSGSSGDEADEEDDSKETRQRKPKRRTLPTTHSASGLSAFRGGRLISGADHGKAHFNRNAPSNLLPSEFYMPETDYQVHYNSSAIYLFAPADEEEVQLVRLNITIQHPPTATALSSSLPNLPAMTNDSTSTTGSSTTSGVSNDSTKPLQTIPSAIDSQSVLSTQPQQMQTVNQSTLSGQSTNQSPTNVSGGINAIPTSSAAVAAAPTAPTVPPTYCYSWTDILAEHPSVKRELMRLTEPRSALIQGHLYFFSQSTMLKLDIHTMKYEVKTLTSVGPRGTNFTSTVICQESQPLVAGAAHILCFGGVAGNIAQSNVHTLDVVTGEWDVPHLSGVIPRPRVEPGGLVYVGDDQHIVVIQGGWNGKNYIDDLDFLHLEEPIAPDPLTRAINNAALSDFTIWAHQDPSDQAEVGTEVSNKKELDAIQRIQSAPTGIVVSSPNPRSIKTGTTSNPTIEGADKSSGDKADNASEKPLRRFLNVNRIILSCRSSFFKNLFELEPNRKEFTLDARTDFRLFSAFIKYLYTDDIEPDLIDDTNANMFIELFSRYAPKHRERVLEELVITRPAIKSTMDTDLTLALNNPLFSDVVFKFPQPDQEEPRRIHAHRALLCTRNDVFGAMLTKPNEEHKGEVTIKGLSYDAFLETLRYIYTFEISPEATENDILLLGILQASHRYGAKNLQSLCIEHISARLSMDTLFPVLTIADELQTKKLLKAVASFIRSNSEALSRLEEYKSNTQLIQRTLDTYFPQQE